MLLGEMLEFSAARYPENLAIVDGDRRYTYREWDGRVNTVANALAELGIRKGDRVVQVVKNREENCAIHMACQKLGAVNTPINFRWASDEIEYCVNDAEAKLVVLEDATRESVLPARERFDSNPNLLFVGPEVPDEAYSFDEIVGAATSEPVKAAVEETHITFMLYTSGTTGRPKGVLRSQRAEYAATVGQIVHHRYGLGERTLGIMPLFHTMGIHSFTAMIALNGLYVAMQDWHPEGALKIIQDEKLTCLYLIPTLFHALVNDEAFGGYQTSSVSKLSYAGAQMLTPLIEDCMDKFEPEVFINHYGSTEVYIFASYPEPRKKPGCAGRAAFHTELRVVRADPEPVVGPEETLPPGETGEIIVRMCDDAFAEYYNRPEATAEAIRDGWYFTSDSGYIDEDGDLWVTGRVDDMIITGGENVYPVEVEDVLSGHPEVEDVAVVGLPDERWGQVVTAFIVPETPDLTEEDITEYCKNSTSLAQFKRPKKVVFVEEIPKSPVGKLLRRMLVEGEYEEIGAAGTESGEAK